MRRNDQKSPELLQAEAAGADALYAWTRCAHGRARRLAEATGLCHTKICKMGKHRLPIDMEAAIAIEVFTCGDLKADVLCPSKATIINRYRAGEHLKTCQETM